MLKSKLFKILLLFSLLCISNYFLFSQKDKEQLEIKRKNTLKEINYANTLLNKTAKSKKESLNKLAIIDKSISLKKNMIDGIGHEIISYKNDIVNYNESINFLEKELSRNIKEYERFIYSAFKNSDHYFKFIYLLSSDNINTAYIRLKYFKYYNDYRRNIVKKIIALKTDLKKKQAALNDKVTKQQRLMDVHVNEKRNFEKEKKKRKVIYDNLKKKEQELKKTLEKNKKLAKMLEDEINKIIREEAKKKANNIKLTPEELKLSSSFKINKGKLPWPTAKGIVTSEFGEHEHPVLKGNIVRNNGIDITTEKQQEVRAIFDGEVRKIIAILGANYTIIIRHGNYISVYQNLVNVRVKENDKVKTKQILGNVYSETEEPILHFEIWDEFEKQNPLNWICKF